MRAARHARGLALGAAGWAFLSAAHAAQPLATQDAGVKPAGACEWESSAARTRFGGETSLTAWTTQLGCGLGADAEMALGLGRSRADGGSQSVWSLAGKTALRPPVEGRTGVALAASVTADQSPGVPPRAQGWLGSLVVTQPLGGSGALLHLNAGLSHDRPTHSTRLSWAVAGERPLGGGLDLTAETFGVGGDRPSAALGLRWASSQRLVLGTAWTHGFCSPATNAVTLVATVGF